jgi:hypothetical protein
MRPAIGLYAGGRIFCKRRRLESDVVTQPPVLSCGRDRRCPPSAPLQGGRRAISTLPGLLPFLGCTRMNEKYRRAILPFVSRQAGRPPCVGQCATPTGLAPAAEVVSDG